MGDTSMSLTYSITRILVLCMVLFAAIAATDPSIERQEFEETFPTALPRAGHHYDEELETNFADGQETNAVQVPEGKAAVMEEVQDKSEAQSEEGWGWRGRRRRRRRRRWWGSHTEKHQKHVARENSEKERAAKERTSKERSAKG